MIGVLNSHRSGGKNSRVHVNHTQSNTNGRSHRGRQLHWILLKMGEVRRIPVNAKLTCCFVANLMSLVNDDAMPL